MNLHVRVLAQDPLNRRCQGSPSHGRHQPNKYVARNSYKRLHCIVLVQCSAGFGCSGCNMHRLLALGRLDPSAEKIASPESLLPNLRMCWETPDCVACSRTAAAVNERSSYAATKMRISRKLSVTTTPCKIFVVVATQVHRGTRQIPRAEFCGHGHLASPLTALRPAMRPINPGLPRPVIRRPRSQSGPI